MVTSTSTFIGRMNRFLTFSLLVPCLGLAASPTVTNLSLSPAGPVTAGTTISLSATVTAAGAAVTSGLILFCNASVTHCEDSTILGTAQLTPGGVAATKLKLGIGSHLLQAKFAGTSSFAASTSPTKSITVTGLPASATSLTVTNLPGHFTFAATVAGFGAAKPTGTVSIVNASQGNASLGSFPLTDSAVARGFFAVPGPITLPVPSGQAVGDFDNDGIPDVVTLDPLDVFNQEGSNIILNKGKGDGTFTPISSPSQGNGAGFVVAADFNGDGLLDLATGNFDSSVTILLGRGDGTFFVKSFYPLALTPFNLTVGDFNGDGVPDLAIAHASSDAITILIGNGDGTFTLKPSFTVPGDPIGLAAADLNGDGLQDIAVTNGLQNTVTILLGNGDGSFTQKSVLPTGDGPNAVAIGDFNSDGKPDLAVLNSRDFDSETVSILLGVGDGTFIAHSSAPVGEGPSGLSVADFNGDGISDIVTSDEAGGTFTVLAGNGDGTFTRLARTSVFPDSAVSVAVGDFNGDGTLDFIGDEAVNVNYPAASNRLTSYLSGFVFNTSVTTALPAGPNKIIASYSGDAHYPGSTAEFTAQFPTPAPVFVPAPGIYQWTQTVKITDSDLEATIYYTTDGTTPTTDSLTFGAPETITWNGVLKAFAVAPGGAPSAVVTATYTIDRPFPAPTFSLPSGTYPVPQSLTLTANPSYCSHATCIIYYTTNGSNPTTASRKYTGPIALGSAGSVTVKAIATAHHFMPSAVASATYNLTSH